MRKKVEILVKKWLIYSIGFEKVRTLQLKQLNFCRILQTFQFFIENRAVVEFRNGELWLLPIRRIRYEGNTAILIFRTINNYGEPVDYERDIRVGVYRNNIDDPLSRWTYLGPIAYHTTLFGAPVANHINVYQCDTCGLYSSDLVRHKTTKHSDDMRESPKRFRLGTVRRRINFDSLEEESPNQAECPNHTESPNTLFERFQAAFRRYFFPNTTYY